MKPKSDEEILSLYFTDPAKASAEDRKRVITVFREREQQQAKQEQEDEEQRERSRTMFLRRKTAVKIPEGQKPITFHDYAVRYVLMLPVGQKVSLSMQSIDDVDVPQSFGYEIKAYRALSYLVSLIQMQSVNQVEVIADHKLDTYTFTKVNRPAYLVRPPYGRPDTFQLSIFR